MLHYNLYRYNRYCYISNKDLISRVEKQVESQAGKSPKTFLLDMIHHRLTYERDRAKSVEKYIVTTIYIRSLL